MNKLTEMEFLAQFFNDSNSPFEDDTSVSDSEETSSASEDDNGMFPNKRVRIENFVGSTVLLYTNKEFQSYFRVTRRTMACLIELVGNAFVLPRHTFGRKPVDPEKGCLVVLWYLANRETFRQISDRFDITMSTAYVVISKIIKCFVSLSPNYIKWPNAVEAEAISNQFKKKQNIAGVIGAIDGCHITIPKPHINQEVYCNRKGYHSILLQGTCDDKKRFIDVFCGEAGSLHDARLLKRSSLYEKAQNGAIFFDDRYFLLGDSAYPSTNWLVPPFRDTGTLSENQRTFNFKHSSTRIIIENAFELLKGRFRRLFGFDNKNIPFVVDSVVACCVLHNICINMDDLQLDIPYDDQGTPEPEEPLQVQENGNHPENDNDRRSMIFHQMFR